ncbi:uncharacterized protein PAN0_061c6527 [Moesziomyces antarcticus]|uniref:Uncharacterized protein n=2 Tax=Pseudozyma antarctica TaxID=84753 RepID=A0A5C3FXM9_PSEA2|nr:uncharacterized protein PAN0_061c6527 [Moesziomyces antarcticus]GAK68285.1 hypothetical protein PAN0_061c6527 [Moesziomyces antarcticus]SPO49138.1 uncharacterized protein PSANT_06829 [Moesziomyces antarcticus]
MVFVILVQAKAESVQKRDRALVAAAVEMDLDRSLDPESLQLDNQTPPAPLAAAVVSTGPAWAARQRATLLDLRAGVRPRLFSALNFIPVLVPAPRRPRPRSAGNLAPSGSHSPWPPAWTLM